MTIGLFVVRVAVGIALVLQGSAKVTREGRRDTAAYFAEVGFRPPLAMALVAGTTEIAAGLLLTAGLATPLAAAGAVGVLASASVVNWSNGYWNANGGAEYPIVLGLTSAALAFTGAGSLSLDELLGWASPSTAVGGAAIVLALVSAAPALIRRRGVMQLEIVQPPAIVPAEAA